MKATNGVAAPGTPEFAVVGDTYRLEWPCGIEGEIERIAVHADELSAEVTLRSSRPPSPGLLHSARMRLDSTQARRTLATALARRMDDLDWDGLIEGMCFLVRERYREGEPSIDLRLYRRDSMVRWLVEPWAEYGGPTTIAAHGGSGKTKTVTGIAVTAATGAHCIGRLHGDPCPVLVLDWETDVNTWDEQLDAVLVGAGIAERPAIHYRRMVASLPESAPMVRRDVARLGIGLVIGDSLGMARGGEPESADMTLRVFASARSLGVPVIFTDHVTNAERDEARKPFGSAYTWNASRLVWTMDKAQDEGADAIAVALVNRKRNNGRLLPRIGYRIEFENGPDDSLRAIRFRRQDIAAVPELAAKLPLKQRILAELRGGPKRPEIVREATGAESSLFRARLSELRQRELVIDLPDGTIALRARESA